MDITTFDKARDLLLYSAKMKGAWEEWKPTTLLYKQIRNSQIRFFDEIRKFCWKVIAELKGEKKNGKK